MSAPSETKPRDPRLDFFRGLGIFIILIAHIPWSSWTEWLPSRFGFSDGADMFVFCSGMASAIAFGRVFDRRGWWLGAARIAHRVWQVYWAHIGSFLVVCALMVAADHIRGGDHYTREELFLADFLANPKPYLPSLFMLAYVPNYFDILPMYIVILCMIPIAMVLARIHPYLAITVSLAAWLAANLGALELPADPVTRRTWFFAPFAWQLVFFTGFAFIRGWLPTPKYDRRLVAACVALIVLALPVSCQDGFQCYAGFGQVPWFGVVHEWLIPLINKHDLGGLRYLHFLATAYLAFLAVGEGGRNLVGPVPELLRRVGQQTLASFLASLVVAQLAGMFMDYTGRNAVTTALANLGGMMVLVIVALIVDWFKSAPWRRPTAEGQAAVSPVAMRRTI
jgi:hypothetical protein